MPIPCDLQTLRTWQQEAVRISWSGDVESIAQTPVQLAYSEPPLAVTDSGKANRNQWNFGSSFTVLTDLETPWQTQEESD